ncbi:hypothetical protein CPT_Sonora_024 [Stenotrophomonas phage Sonora]|nr:hypothetical protein CPT_Sonora_024 [Stenotrophomonas phage Sonora]
MKNIPVQLLTALQKSGRSTCYLVKVIDTAGGVHGFATLDAVVNFDDGTGMLAYLPDQEMRPQNIQSTSDMDVDNTELEGWFGPAIENLVVAGLFSLAEVWVYRVSYLRLNYGAEVVAFGNVGKIEYSSNSQGKRKIEWRSLAHLLKQKVNDQWSLTCRVPFGSPQCGKPLVWQPGQVADVEDNFLRFRVSGITRPDDYFVLGVVRFTSGDNTGAELEIESWTSDGWVTLSFVTPFAIDSGVFVSLRQDCDKTEFSCKAYNNIPNMRAEHLTPVQDQSLMVPGAYIKSQNAL